MRKPNNLKSAFILFFVALAFSMQSFAQEGNLILSFDNSVKYGTQKNNLTILVSNDFDGKYNLESIKAAKWVNITKSFSLTNDAIFSPAGKADISKYKVAGKPLYVAFKYLGEASAKPSQRGWAVTNLNLKGKSLDKAFQFSDFNIVNNEKNHEGASWRKESDSGIRYASNRSLIASESWAIVKVLD